MRAPIPVNILIADDCWGGMVLLVKEALAVAGTLLARSTDIHASALFDVRLTGLDFAPVRSFTGPMLEPEQTLRTAAPARVIVVPPFFFHDELRKPLSEAVRSWLVAAYDGGAIILMLASGARLLAETGLLDGHIVTGNLSDQRVFASLYPQIRFSPETPLVIDGRLISAASINPAMDACSYLVNHFIGEQAAHKLQRYANSVAQPTYERVALRNAAFKQHGDLRVKQAQEFIERYFKEDITVADAARRSAMSLRNLSRRFQEAVGMAAHDYIVRCRLEHAKDLLEHAATPILQVALRSGFRNEVMLRRAFQNSLAMTPSAYRRATGVRHTVTVIIEA